MKVLGVINCAIYVFWVIYIAAAFLNKSNNLLL